jgi:hypothetical protein
MNKKFLALAEAEIEERIPINDDLIDAYIDPVYEHGMRFSGEVMIVGNVRDDASEDALAAILQDYLNEYVDQASVRKVEFQEEKAPDLHGRYQGYRKAG